MTHPPSRADQVRLMGGQGSKPPPRQASMTAIDMDDEKIRPDAWFAYLMPTQIGVEIIGAGRYGYWDRQPDVEHDGDCIVITGRSDAHPEPTGPEGTMQAAYDDGPGGEEPILVVPKAAVVSVLVAKAKHVEASPFPVVPAPEVK
jgi:hypothetical protein